ncbi:SRPBCC domain-containing protein [Bacillus shivajii]|uniref:SRPBCC family protein n=1 Tax=Bacillus shivajii TaxID=1983719 RepID=UPI001CF9B553|nr:SRPBCC domain-containing protein [Bacillus shivajii]UCZ53606.1 SRPBCC domain-containing protein [Bacillus shivajii]
MSEQNNQLPEIQKHLVLNAPIQKVWDAVATSEGIAEWFMPNNFEPKEGHEFYLESPFGQSPCKVTEIDEPNKLSFTWDRSGWFVTFELTEVDGKTEFTLTHGGWGNAEDVITGTGEKQGTVHDRMNNGWESIVYDALKKAVEG